MAQKVNIILVDDIDGSDASQTVAFGLDGSNYEIDLNDKNANALREALAAYVGHARKVGRGAGGGGGAKRGRAAASANGGVSAKEVREWARANGHDVPERGRIPSDVREAYDAAH
ncbi:Lsr2 family protein [Pimelobacter simplex]|uniref:Histone protein Lsr2 n=1 Tax=Nocardioides simplex TaxID=2045 RepID=A0A0A1DFL3_NOCSI|nr:Lsr2 family protein [Pimelobacter simplex]AIY16056.1 Histone protein Lsr2 [Pimelobacter simplex]KAB2808216.1 Lsr2 family protein [Pimelobacter simplex]MCG8151067.1 Lsr2 family protein [Pimelobacter simplex]SFM96903.1 Lsr2 protein [Pimelobacter simplex]GEB12302.1 Lsr2 family protein [Pimelobacter simplex]